MKSFIPTPSNPNSAIAAYNNYGANEEIRNRHLISVSGILSDALVDNHIAQRRRVRVSSKVEIVKLRALETTNEIFFMVNHHHSHVLSVRFLKHTDRFYSTTSLRTVERQVSFDMNETDPKDLNKFILSDVLAWLTPGQANVRHPGTLFIALDNQLEPKSALTAGSFVIATARVSTSSGEPCVELANADGSIKKSVSTRAVETHTMLSALSGRHYVEFFNGEYAILTPSVFKQQFSYPSTPTTVHGQWVN